MKDYTENIFVRNTFGSLNKFLLEKKKKPNTILVEYFHEEKIRFPGPDRVAS